MSSSKGDIYYVYTKLDFEGVPRYIGKGHGNRCYAHENSKKPHWNTQMRVLVEEARRRNMSLPTLKVAENVSEEEAFRLERVFIAEFGRERHGGTLYNWTDGGEGGSGHTWTEKQKANHPMLGKKHSEESKAKMRLAKLGGKHTEEHARKISAANKGRKFSKEHVAKIVATKTGKPLSENHRKNLSESHKGYIMPEEQKLNISIANKGRKHSMESRENFRKAWIERKLHKEGRKLLKEERRAFLEALDI